MGDILKVNNAARRVFCGGRRKPMRRSSPPRQLLSRLRLRRQKAEPRLTVVLWRCSAGIILQQVSVLRLRVYPTRRCQLSAKHRSGGRRGSVVVWVALTSTDAAVSSTRVVCVKDGGRRRCRTLPKNICTTSHPLTTCAQARRPMWGLTHLLRAPVCLQ